MPGPSPLVGYNTNVRHKGKLYHIQTEDSGVNHPHVITHLFADGGRIIASRKSGYAEHLGASDLPTIVKRLMQEQHKAMFIELRDCVYDDQPAPSQSLTEARPAVPAAQAAPPPPPALPPPVPAASSMTAAVAAVAALAAAPATRPMPPAPPLPLGAVPRTAVPSPGNGPVVPGQQAATTVPVVPAPKFVGTPQPMAIPSRVQLQLDAEALDRAAEARLLDSAMGRMRAEAARRGAGRYQQTMAARPSRVSRAPSARSSFGGEALRGKSWDEVILSYLSDDAGESER